MRGGGGAEEAKDDRGGLSHLYVSWCEVAFGGKGVVIVSAFPFVGVEADRGEGEARRVSSHPPHHHSQHHRIGLVAPGTPRAAGGGDPCMLFSSSASSSCFSLPPHDNRNRANQCGHHRSVALWPLSRIPTEK